MPTTCVSAAAFHSLDDERRSVASELRRQVDGATAVDVDGDDELQAVGILNHSLLARPHVKHPGRVANELTNVKPKTDEIDQLNSTCLFGHSMWTYSC